jgi:glycosyl transferase family 87
MRRFSPDSVARLLLLALALLVSLSLFHAPGTGDVDLWRRWMTNVHDLGLRAGYAANLADYPPGSSILLLGATRMADGFGLKRLAALKLSLFAFLWLTAVLVGLWSRSVRLAAATAFALMLNSVGLGYLDVYFAPTLVLALWALATRRYALFSVAFSLSCLTKWQPVLVAPFVLVHLLGDLRPMAASERRRRVAALLVPAALIWGGAFALFGEPMWLAWGRATTHRSLSGNALNLCWVMTDALHRWWPSAYGGLQAGRAQDIVTDDRWLLLGPRVLFAAAYLLALAFLWKHRGRLVGLMACSLLGTLSYFMLSSGVHENHLFLPVLLAVVLALLDPDHGMLFALWAIAASLNLFLFYGPYGIEPPMSRVVGVDLALLAALVNLALFTWTWVVLVQRRPIE